MEARDILTAAEIDALRSGYDGAALSKMAADAIAGAHAPARGFLDFVTGTFYGKESDLPPRDRELVLITLFAARESSLFLGVHIYWGLMEGLTPATIAQALLLAGAYQGLPVFNESIGVLAKTLTALKELLTPSTGVGAANVIAALAKILGSR